MNEMIESFKIDFVGIGAAKAGTTWLGHMLEGHPEVSMSVPKEVYFFNDMRFYGSKASMNFAKGISWYKKHFRHATNKILKGEITPGYSIDAIAAERIKAHNPDIKILYCLRNPVDRIESHYNFVKSFLGEETRPMDQVIMEERELIEMSMYFKNISTYLDHFAEDQICIVWFEDIASQPAIVLDKVYSFLGVDHHYRPVSMHEKSNPGRRSRFPGLQQFISGCKKVFIWAGLSGLIRKVKMAGLGDFMTKFNSRPIKKESLTPELRQYIIEQVRDDVNKLAQWAKKDLKHWLT